MSHLARYFDIDSTFSKVDHSPMATAYLEAIIERSSPDHFFEDQRDTAVRIAQRHGAAPHDGRFDVVYDD